MHMVISNSAVKEKRKYDDIQDLILSEEVRRKDFGETYSSDSGSALSTENRGRGSKGVQVTGIGQNLKSIGGRMSNRPIGGRMLEFWQMGDYRKPSSKHKGLSLNKIDSYVHTKG